MDIEKKKTDAKNILFKRTAESSEIVELTHTLKPREQSGLHILNMHGMRACPVFTDMRASLPMLGGNYHEKTARELRSAVFGGYGNILLSPTFLPTPDRRMVLSEMDKRVKNMTDCRVYFSVPLTLAGAGKTLCDFSALKTVGAVAANADFERSELSMGQLFDGVEHAKKAGLLFIAPKGKKSLDQKGSVNAGKIARYYKEYGIDPTSELAALNDAIVLAKRFDTPVHFPIVTLKESIEVVRRAKKEGVPITCATAPCYFTFTEDEPLLTGTNAKVLPPLRNAKDRMAVIEGLADGTIDCICSDHTPASPTEKNRDMQSAAFGAIGFQTAFAAGITALVDNGWLSVYRLIELMSVAPAKILGIPFKIAVGAQASFAFIDTAEENVISSSILLCESHNTPFLGRVLSGGIKELWLNGIKQF